MRRTMDKAKIRQVIDGVTGDPGTGAVADVVPAIVDALDAALNGKAVEPVTTRVMEADETR